jgi:hypothetical protein
MALSCLATGLLRIDQDDILEASLLNSLGKAGQHLGAILGLA